ncbi:MAG: STAS domain-containing protein [Alphaproteobacteria bacterium]
MRLTHPDTSITVLHLSHTLDSESSHTFRQLVRQALEAKPTTLALDMTELTYIDSTGLGLLALTRTEAERIGCAVTLANVPNGHPRKVLELMKFDQMFPTTYAA